MVQHNPKQIPMPASIVDASPEYKEIHILHRKLEAAGIPHIFRRFVDGWCIMYPTDGDACIADVVEHAGSYGHYADKLELMGLLTPEEHKIDSVAGWLTAEDVFVRIREHYVLSCRATTMTPNDMRAIMGYLPIDPPNPGNLYANAEKALVRYHGAKDTLRRSVGRPSVWVLRNGNIK